MIKIIGSKEAKSIINEYKPKGLFIILDAKGTYVGIDNMSCNAWTEEFKDLKVCLMWLNGWNFEDLEA
ncbi:hypothetical protein [Clostridium akagii]|uniref:hypothetical protein n=1 Tax=Clostridium akagii TaxID=91623 RepID=UPI00047E18B7|nr:hypothetical protein [Clostridium akagii]